MRSESNLSEISSVSTSTSRMDSECTWTVCIDSQHLETCCSSCTNVAQKHLCKVNRVDGDRKVKLNQTQFAFYLLINLRLLLFYIIVPIICIVLILLFVLLVMKLQKLLFPFHSDVKTFSHLSSLTSIKIPVLFDFASHADDCI